MFYSNLRRETILKELKWKYTCSGERSQSWVKLLLKHSTYIKRHFQQ